ncbi:MAG: DUF308 domain-containing protein [Lachnospiraceae bacterium]|nr:DUF308 domain-containing protein [Lachnospiraceae bacterium]
MRNIMWDILMIVIGVVLIMFPGTAMDVSIKVIGVLLLVAGATGVILGIKGQGAYQIYTMSGAVVSIVAGVVCLLQPGIIKSILPLVMGIVILATGILNIVNAFAAKRAGASKWLISLLLAIVTVIMGIVILLNLNGTADLLVSIIGFIFVYNGVSMLIMKILNRV